MGTFIEAIDVNAESIDIRYRPERIIGTQKKNYEHVVHSSVFWGAIASLLRTKTCTFELPEKLQLKKAA